MLWIQHGRTRMFPTASVFVRAASTRASSQEVGVERHSKPVLGAPSGLIVGAMTGGQRWPGVTTSAPTSVTVSRP